LTPEKSPDRIADLRRVSGEQPRRLTSSFIGRSAGPAPRTATGDRPGGLSYIAIDVRKTASQNQRVAVSFRRDEGHFFDAEAWGVAAAWADGLYTLETNEAIYLVNA
jgi:hypothetical protein